MVSERNVKSITLRARFDGERICPDEPLDMAPDTEVLVTVVRIDSADQEHQEWLRFSQASLSPAYQEDEADYPLSSIKRLNPEYEGSI